MRSTAGLLTEGAEAAGPALFFELALAVLAAAPSAGEQPADTDRLHHLEGGRRGLLPCWVKRRSRS